jgi:membrane protease YdiL (CAAX protease family)
MERAEKRSELIKLIIVYAIELLIMIGLEVGFNLLDKTNANPPMIVKSIIIYGLLLIPVIVYSKKKGDSFLEVCKFKKIKVSTVLLTVLLTIVSCPMYIFANLVSQLFVPNIMAQSMNQILDGSAALALVATTLFAPICEEMICRGFFQNRLKNVLPFMASAIVSGIMFGALHLNLNQFCYAFVLGVIFAYVNRASGTVITSMIMHFLINFGNMLMLMAFSGIAATQGGDLGQMAETARANKQVMLSGISVYGILAIIAFFLCRLIIKAIAKREQTIDIEQDEQLAVETVEL